MTRKVFASSLIALGVLALGGALAPAAAADVRIGVHLGAPPVIVAPPAPVVVAPPAPVVVAPTYVSPGVPIYYYGANYYTFYNGGWFYTPTYGHPWAYVRRGHVPRAIIGVPGAYYRIPHHHAAHFGAPHHWGHGHRKWDSHHGRHHRKHH